MSPQNIRAGAQGTTPGVAAGPWRVAFLTAAALLLGLEACGARDRPLRPLPGPVGAGEATSDGLSCGTTGAGGRD